MFLDIGGRKGVVLLSPANTIPWLECQVCGVESDELILELLGCLHFD